MSELRKKIFVQCPLPRAASQIVHCFQENADADGVVHLSLRAPVELARGLDGMALERAVNVTVSKPYRIGMDEALDIAWTPSGDGLLPSFRGRFTVEADEDYDAFWLCLSGDYTPPLGVAGSVFDAAIGHRIAMATAGDLLGRIRDEIEQSCRAAEASKHAQPPASAR